VISRGELCVALDEALEVSRFKDYGPNGLQVEGRHEVRRIVTGVTASERLIQAAVDEGADLIVAHHGLFWGGDPIIRGGLARRLKLLLEHQITLLAYHLPLDGHPELGNSALLARALGLVDVTPFWSQRGGPVGVRGRLPEPEAAAAFRARLDDELEQILELREGPARIEDVVVVTGAGAGAVYEAAWSGVSALVTGEASEFVTHAAREEHIHVFAAGHHATEVYGVRNLAAWLKARFDVEARYVDIPNPV
jgi:dinuclear metal center YbgI/SA1388 family protein